MENVEEIIDYAGKQYSYTEYMTIKNRPPLPGQEHIFTLGDLLKKSTCSGHKSTIIIDIDANQLRILFCCDECENKFKSSSGVIPYPYIG